MIPALITGSVAALGAIGTLAVKSAVYITLPEKVEANEKLDAEQNKLLDRLTYISEQQVKQNEYWQQQQLQQQIPNQAYQPPDISQVQMEEWQDESGRWFCCDPRTDCTLNDNWWHC